MANGRAFKLKDDISTDHIIPGRYYHLRSNLAELAKHTLEDVRPSFAREVRAGDFIVAGKNFGLGSSREHAPLVLKMLGVKAILARSAARIFFRNAVNLGMPVLLCDTDKIDDGDEMEIELSAGIVNNRTKGTMLKFRSFPDVMLNILSEGGLLPYIKKYGQFKI